MASFLQTDVDSKNLLEAVNKIDGCIVKLQSIHTAVCKELMQKLNPYWQGAAKDGFESDVNAFAIEFEKYVNKHIKLNETLKNAARDYEKSDDSVARRISRLA